MRLLVATTNRHKVGEIRALLGPAWDPCDLGALPGYLPPAETGQTFAENAAIKAVTASAAFGGWALADDSGLEVDALGGAPGVESARYAGPGATDALNREKLLRELARVGALDQRPGARFRCAVALARAGELIATFDGAVEGHLLAEERGGGGFGYDPLFVPEGFTETFGQLPAEVKNTLSHRARAMGRARAFLQSLPA